MSTSITLRPTARRMAVRPGFLLGALAVIVAACGGGASATPGVPTSTAPGASGAPATPSPTPVAPVELTVGLGYIPSVQFAQFYLADQAGYYRDAGLEVTFQNKIDPDLVTLVGQGAIDIGIADGTSVIPAVSQGIPIRYVATVYADVPQHRLRQGIVGDHRTGRPRRQEDRHPRQVRLVVDHAPGAARGRGPHPVRRRDRAITRTTGS